MTIIELFFLTLFTSGVTIISYKGYALKQGWPIGTLFYSDSSIIKIIGMLAILVSFVVSFFFIKWYLVLAGALIGWLISGALTAIFRVKTQSLSLVLLLLSLILLIFL